MISLYTHCDKFISDWQCIYNILRNYSADIGPACWLKAST